MEEFIPPPHTLKQLLCSAGQVSGVPGSELAGWSVCALLRHPVDVQPCCRVGWTAEAGPAEKVGFGPGSLNLYLMETGYLALKRQFPRMAVTDYHRLGGSKQENSVLV